MNQYAAGVVLVRVGPLIIITESLVQLLDTLLDLVLPNTLIINWRLGGFLVQFILIKAVLLVLSGVFKLLLDRVVDVLILLLPRVHLLVNVTAASLFLFVAFFQRSPYLLSHALRRGRPLLRSTFATASTFAFMQSTGHRTLHFLPPTSLEHLQLALDFQVLLAELMVDVMVGRVIQILIHGLISCTLWLLRGVRHYCWVRRGMLSGVRLAKGVRLPRLLHLLTIIYVILARWTTLWIHQTIRLVERYRQL